MFYKNKNLKTISCPVACEIIIETKILLISAQYPWGSGLVAHFVSDTNVEFSSGGKLLYKNLELGYQKKIDCSVGDFILPSQK